MHKNKLRLVMINVAMGLIPRSTERISCISNELKQQQQKHILFARSTNKNTLENNRN